MTNQIFEISVYYFDMDFEKFKKNHRIYSREQALQYGMEIGVCDNVERVDITDFLTGELILSMVEGEITWIADEI